MADTRPDRWRRLMVALLLGIVTMGVLAFIATLFQTPGLEAPVQIAPIAVLTVVLGVTAIPLVWWDDAVAALSDAAAVVGIARYPAGAFRPTRVAPAAYVMAVLGAVLVLTTVASWRGRNAAPLSRPPPSPP